MERVSKFPHNVVVQISRADNLLLNSDKKGRKLNKWRVIIMGAKKKTMTDYSPCPDGNPIWNSEIIVKLNIAQLEPIVLVVVDFSNNQMGQVVIPILALKPGGTSSYPDGSAPSWICGELEPSSKCSQPSGHLFYRIWVDEYYPEESIDRQTKAGGKRLSIFGWKHDQKSSTYIPGGSQINVSRSEKSKVPKRLSFFKSNDKSENPRFKKGKAKSLANIHIIDTIEQSQSSDSDLDKKACFPPDNIYDDVTEDLGWIRVGDVNGDRSTVRHSSVTTNGHDIVDIWSVQPDNGPITGDFTVVMEGSNFMSGLYDLTFVCIDGLEPIDANTCTEIVSDTELILTMPPVSHPGMVNINLELLDGSMISCSKTFHYIDPATDDSQCPIFTPRIGDDKFPDLSSLDDVINQYEDVLSSPMHDYKPKTTNNQLGLKRDSGMGSFNEVTNAKSNRRKLSDYGSQGSVSSERNSSIRRKSKQITMTKMELFEEVGVLRKEVASLQIQLLELASSTNTQITAFKCQLEARDTEIDNISKSLCNLKVKLLEDGLTDYLELK